MEFPESSKQGRVNSGIFREFLAGKTEELTLEFPESSKQGRVNSGIHREFYAEKSRL